jgi:hypothetical protein
MAIDYPKGDDEWEDWARLWWKSMLNIPKGSNPIIDQTGENFKNFKQPGDSKDVWFLAGNVGGTDVRKITVKKGKALFFPEVNYVGCKEEGFGDNVRAITELDETESSLYFNRGQKDPESDARKDIDEAEKSTTVDYEGPVKQRIRKRVTMPFMNIDFADPPVMGGRAGTATCLFDGYWIFTEPLDAVGEKATITIQSKHPEIHESNGKSHSFSSKVVYKIDIVS